MRLPRSVYNRITYAGAAIAALAFITFVFLFIFHSITGAGRAYAGLVIFLLVPAVLLFGLLLIPIGMVRERRRVRRTGETAIPALPVIDFNQARYRNATAIFVVVSVLVLFLSVFGSYEAYETTDSVEFCGALCHQVMEPEYTTYQHSPHARVACVDCHVGPGADWYVRSKLAGLYQVYAVLADRYPRPIPTPIESLRPARETCEQCHWPSQFFGGQERRRVHFLGDEKNTRWEIDLLVKIGGGSEATAQTEGIHWHMNVANRIEYFARDRERQVIPWIRSTNVATGEITEYRSTSDPPSGKELAGAEIRTMDCMDCHSRPTHRFHSPSHAVNLALAAGRIDPTLPFVKQQGVELLAASYPSKAEGLAAIEAGLERFYREKHPAVADARSGAIGRAASELQEIYRRNFFPAMKVRWDVYENNVGHKNSPGCFRCHDGQHESADGRVLDRDCDTCHIIMVQGETGSLETSMERQGVPFRHPVDIGEAWKELACSDCHTGAGP
jgi:hypothetical protein